MARRGVPLLGDSSTPVDHALGLVEASAFDVQGGCVKATAERRRSDTALRQRVPQSPSMRKPCYRVREDSASITAEESLLEHSPLSCGVLQFAMEEVNVVEHHESCKEHRNASFLSTRLT
ncbi:hypothetical protein MUK42_28561 [Musa troglodytarum]|uniref:Uncharacterized protein n=1 Tax=Musa troglodytarum TaxID=320322 RepID=A0A9E7F2T4_9LILI|nr:hypothetical protein MUK42_28561 [Musa troglodytarum]